MTTNDGGTTTISGGTVETSGDQTFNDAVDLGNNSVLTAGTGNISFNRTLDGSFKLTANSSGTTTFGGYVGSTTPLTGIVTDAAGTTAINTAAVVTANGTGQTYNDPVTIGANATLSADADIVFNNTVNNGDGETVQSGRKYSGADDVQR